MTFGRPDLLWLFTLALPVILLHFLRRRRKVLRISSLILWDEVLSMAPRRFGLRSLTSLLSLLLLLLALGASVLAAADPRVGDRAPAPRHLVILLCGSARMEGERWDRAVELALGEIDRKAVVDPVTVLLVSDEPRVLAARTTDPEAARMAVEGAAPTLTEAAWALAGPAAQLALGEDARVVAIGVHPEVPEGVTVLPVGGTNSGISGFGAEVKEQAVDLLIRTAGTGPGAEVVVTLEGREVWREPATAELSVTLDRAEGGLLTVALVPPSGPAFDDRVEALIPPARRLKLGVSAEGGADPFLKAALEISRPFIDEEESGAVPVERLAAAAERFDVMIVAGAAPEQLAPGDWILLTPPPAALGLSPLPAAEFSPVWERAADHPVTAGVDAAEVQVAGAAPAALPEGAVALLTLPGGAVAAAGVKDGIRYVWIGLDPANSTLPITGAFPLMIRNALRWFGSLSTEPLPPQFQLGEALRPEITLPPGARAVVVTGPDPSDREVVPVVRGSFEFRPAARAEGEVTVRLWEHQRSTRLNAVLPAETAVEPLAGQPEVAPDRSGLLDTEEQLWPLLVAAAGVFLLLEWAVHWLTREI